MLTFTNFGALLKKLKLTCTRCAKRANYVAYLRKSFGEHHSSGPLHSSG